MAVAVARVFVGVGLAHGVLELPLERRKAIASEVLLDVWNELWRARLSCSSAARARNCARA